MLHFDMGIQGRMGKIALPTSTEVRFSSLAFSTSPSPLPGFRSDRLAPEHLVMSRTITV